MQRINNFLKISLYFSCIYPITTWTMSNTEIKIRDKYKMELTYSATELNTLQELIIYAKRQQPADQKAMLLKDVTLLAELYSQEGDKLNDIRNPKYSPEIKYTALQLSAFAGLADIFKILLAYNANPHIPCKEIQFGKKSQGLKMYTHNLENLIEERGNLCSSDAINSNAAESMLAALSTRKWSLLWSSKTPEERAKLLGITLPTQEPIS